MDYQKTLNLPKTGFPMKANLPENEPKVLPRWREVYRQLEGYSGKRKKYILHDGPPYANGEIHIGHAINKILKDQVLHKKKS